MRSDDNSFKTDKVILPLFVPHLMVTSTSPIVSVKRLSAILRIDVIGLIKDLIGIRMVCLTTLMEAPESTIALTTPILEMVTSMIGRRVGTSRAFTAGPGPGVRLCRFPSDNPYFQVDSPVLSDQLDHIDNNDVPHLEEPLTVGNGTDRTVEIVGFYRFLF